MAEEIASICYTEACNIITLLADCNHGCNHYDLTGVLWPEGVVIWEHCGSLNGESLDPQDVTCTPQGHVCIANTTNVMLLDPKTGSLISILLKEPNVSNVCEVVCQDDDDKIRVTVTHGEEKATKISCYNYKIFDVEYDEFAVPIIEPRPEQK